MFWNVIYSCDAKDTFSEICIIIINNVENSWAVSYFCWNCNAMFSEFFDKWKKNQIKVLIYYLKKNLLTANFQDFQWITRFNFVHHTKLLSNKLDLP